MRLHLDLLLDMLFIGGLKGSKNFEVFFLTGGVTQSLLQSGTFPFFLSFFLFPFSS